MKTIKIKPNFSYIRIKRVIIHSFSRVKEEIQFVIEIPGWFILYGFSIKRRPKNGTWTQNWPKFFLPSRKLFKGHTLNKIFSACIEEHLEEIIKCKKTICNLTNDSIEIPVTFLESIHEGGVSLHKPGKGMLYLGYMFHIWIGDQFMIPCSFSKEHSQKLLRCDIRNMIISKKILEPLLKAYAASE